MTTDDQNTVERLIDAHGLFAVLDCLSGICGLKAEHLASNWQDTNAAKEWERAANALDKAASRVLDLGL